MGLLLFELGHSLELPWLRRNTWLLATSLLEAVLTSSPCTALRTGRGGDIYAAGAAAIGIATSPAAIVQVTRELRAQGQVTERLKMLTALNSAYAVVGVTIWLSWLHLEYEATARRRRCIPCISSSVRCSRGGGCHGGPGVSSLAARPPEPTLLLILALVLKSSRARERWNCHLC